jgi:acetyl-CoA acetyltransferase
MRDVAIVSFAQSNAAREDRNEVEILLPVVKAAVASSKLERSEIGFTCSGSSDFLQGQPFAFVMALDGVGAWPPIKESHVEMDGAWALYEAWVKIQTGAADTALVYSYGKSSPGDLPRVLSRQLDPYVYGPLWPTSIDLAALQGRAVLDAGLATRKELDAIAAARHEAGTRNPHATPRQLDLADQGYLAEPLRKADCCPISDGAVAVILAADDRATELSDRPAWIRGIDHRIDAHALGARDLASSPSTALAAAKAGVGQGPVDIAELHACFTPQEVILAQALGLDDDCDINPSGGALAANPMMAAGLVRIVEAARRITDGSAHRAVAHATSGPCLQQNLVCVLEGDDS